MKLPNYIELIVITATYLLGTYFVGGKNIILFSILWQIAILIYLFCIRKVKVDLSYRQIIVILSSLFLFSLIKWVIFYDHSYMSLIRTAFLAPIAEEVLFRKYFFDIINGDNKKKIICSSALFSIYHLKNFHILSASPLIQQIIYAGLVIGIITAYIRVKTKSIQWPIIIHSFNNSIYAMIK